MTLCYHDDIPPLCNLFVLCCVFYYPILFSFFGPPIELCCKYLLCAQKFKSPSKNCNDTSTHSSCCCLSIYCLQVIVSRLDEKYSFISGDCLTKGHLQCRFRFFCVEGEKDMCVPATYNNCNTAAVSRSQLAAS